MARDEYQPMTDTHTTPAGLDDYSFNSFARQPFYQEENSRLVDLVGLQPGNRVIDLACGPGEITRKILNKVRGQERAWILGVDMSPETLDEARQQFTDVTDTDISFQNARAEDLSHIVSEPVDAVVFCNAIHLVDNKPDVLGGIKNALRPGGLFAFNSTFYSGSIVQDTDPFYRRWMMRSLRLLKSNHGLRTSKNKVMARQQLTADEYKELLRDAGFSIRDERVIPIDVPIEGWLSICSFSDFVEGALPGVQIETASEVLRDAIVDTFREMELSHVPRNWLEIVAVRD